MNYEPLYTFAEKHRVPYNELCTALRAALAAPQPEPVAEVIDREHQPWEHGKHTSWLVNPSDLPAGTKLYAAAPPAAPAPVVREPQYWCPETGELCGKCAKTGTCEASILQAHGIGGGGNG